MGLPVPDVKFLFALFKKYKIKGKILSLGSQDVYINETELKKLTKKYGFKKIKKSILKSKSAEFNKFRESKNFISPESMFEAIGIKKKNYFDVDKFNFDRPKILHDLQKPITKKIKTKFDFIIDGGTLEHIFDIANVMKNLVKITAVGGRILHIIPCHNYVNHGFYSFSPTFIYDFYILNNFKIEEMYIAEIGLIKKRFFKYNHNDSVDGYYLNRKKRHLIYALLKKKKSIKKILIPDQSFYTKKRKLDKSLNFINFLKNFVPFKFHGIFFDFFYTIKFFLSKKKYFDIDNFI